MKVLSLLLVHEVEHDLFLLQCRVTSCEERESNFVIFYEMLMGLSMQEKG